jgi:hypothetical protein
MAIRVVSGSAQLPVTKRPVLNIDKNDTNTNMMFTCVELMGEKPVLIEIKRPIEMRGRCTIAGDPDDDPAGWTLGLIQFEKAFRYLKHLFWNVHWQTKFLPTNFTYVAAPWTITRTGGPLGNSVKVSRTFDGRPTDPRFAGIGAAVLAPNCGKAMAAARAASNTRESLKWD